jgi:hypothetical protein
MTFQNRNHALIGRYGVWVGSRNAEVQLFDEHGNQVNQDFRKTWWVDTNVGVDSSNYGHTSARPFLTLANVGTQVTAGNIEPGDRVKVRGNINELWTPPVGAVGITIEGEAGNPQHADTHPLNLEKYATTWKIGSLGNSPLLTLRYPGWTFKNILFAAHASNYAVKLERNAIEDATEQDASHARFINCRFASGAGGISDTGGTYNVKIYDCTFQALTTACILGVGNIGVGQLGWELIGNKFLNFTNGVKIAGHECIIEDNKFTDGGTPNTTFVLNTNNGGGRDNFVVKNYFQTADANYGTPDLVGCATDVWRNDLIDATAKTGTP